MPGLPSHPAVSLADRVRAILASRGLSIAEAARDSGAFARDDSRLHLPPNFLSSLRTPRFSPSLYQLEALSRLSDYRLIDWLAVFGLSLDDATRFQAQLPARRTVPLDASVYATASLPWMQDVREANLANPLTPLSLWIATHPRLSFPLASLAQEAYRYVKIGSEDTFAFPDLLPGSIVRIDTRLGTLERFPVEKSPGRTLYLVEHGRGLVCSRLSRSGPKTIVLCSRQLPYAAVELHESSQARILGVADLEIRATRHLQVPIVPPTLGQFWTPQVLKRLSSVGNVGELFRECRKRSGLSFRQASERTALVADALGDTRYYCSPGALSDYETRKLPPRHVHKLIAIAAAYFIDVRELLEHAGVDLGSHDQNRMPDHFLERRISEPSPSDRRSNFMQQMAVRFTHIPYFLLPALPSIFGLSDFSIRDIFWAGGVAGSIGSYSTGAQFLIVDRKHKTPRPSLSTPLWAQPAFVLQRRDGSYTWGFCALQNGTLIVRVCQEGSPTIQRLRHGADAELVGEVVGVIRTLP